MSIDHHEEAASQDSRRRKSRALMQTDARLPDDVSPARSLHTHPTRALVTGATGFLGRYTVRALLQQTELHLVCLVRHGEGVSARQRVVDALIDIGVDAASLQSRISVVVGDIGLPQFGLAADHYQRLTVEIGRVYHCAAHVNWARNYRQLRDINVCGALELIRFSCLFCRKPLVFVSTIAVCFAYQHEGRVTEETDMLEHIERMPLGYAQSKCVAENLMKQAYARGLPVAILRPSLISGDSQNGNANPDDLIAALIEGCARAGVCGDSDWLLDCVPVDLVADVIARVPVPVPELACQPVDDDSLPFRPTANVGSDRPLILHLVHDKPCHWSDAIACLNGFGCPVRLVAIVDWARIVFADRHASSARLYGYRRFFTGFAGMPAPFESYLQQHQERVNSDFTYQLLQSMGLSIPALDQNLLFRYLKYYDRNGLLPARKVASELA